MVAPAATMRFDLVDKPPRTSPNQSAGRAGQRSMLGGHCRFEPTTPPYRRSARATRRGPPAPGLAAARKGDRPRSRPPAGREPPAPACSSRSRTHNRDGLGGGRCVCHERVDQTRQRPVVDASAGLGDRDRQADRQMRLAHPGSRTISSRIQPAIRRNLRPSSSAIVRAGRCRRRRASEPGARELVDRSHLEPWQAFARALPGSPRWPCW